MKRLGEVIFALGVIGMTAAFGMDTSVPTDLREGINDLGLMRDQQNYIILSGLMILVGLAIFLAGGRLGASGEGSIEDPQQKKCPECAEVIKRDAKVCRYCGNREFDEAERPNDICVSSLGEVCLIT